MTAPRYLLDTNICIYIRSRHPAKVLARFEKVEVGEAAISVVTYGELFYGTAKSVQSAKSAAALERLVSILPVLPLPPDAGKIYGRIRAALAAKGSMIGANDLWIAAHAMALGLVLVTNNEREFRNVKELSIDNWAT